MISGQVHIFNSNFSNINSPFIVRIEKEAGSVYINESSFLNNNGSPILINARKSQAFITGCEFTSNFAKWLGGAITSLSGISVITNSSFTNNTGPWGWAVFMRNSYCEILGCVFKNNFPFKKTGATIVIESKDEQTSAFFKDIILTSYSGSGAVQLIGSRLNIERTIFINKKSEKVDVTEAKACIYTFNSRVDITGPLTISDNIGGAIRAVQSQIYINSTGNTVISNNTASSEGGIMLRESELVIRSPIIISENRAQMFGGGIYAYQSIVHFISKGRSNFIISNIAGWSGGGVYTAASSVKLSYSHVTIDSNTALLSGGGIYLQQNSRIYLFKQEKDREEPIISLKVTSNSAVFGGGVYVADNSTVGDLQCQGAENPSAATLCFFQTIQLYHDWFYAEKTHQAITFLINNTAEFGSALYGGLLDRCTVSPQAEAYFEVNNGLEYVNKTVMISKGSTITSDPVQVVLCGKHNYFPIRTLKGKAFKMSVSAIDQVGNPVNATIHSSVVTKSGVSRLKEGQAEQRVGNQCTELEYNVFSQDSSAQMEIYAGGPCSNMGLSKQIFMHSYIFPLHMSYWITTLSVPNRV